MRRPCSHAGAQRIWYHDRNRQQRRSTEAIRDARIGAVDAVVRRMDDSAEFGDIVRASFPDENYNTFDEWLDAQMTYDVNEGISNLWQGGGQWILYGLGLFYSLQIYVHALDGRTNTFAGATAQSGTEVVDARGQSDTTHGSETKARTIPSISHLFARVTLAFRTIMTCLLTSHVLARCDATRGSRQTA